MKNLYESLLDDFEELASKQDKGIAADWCEKNFQGKYKMTMSKKDNSVKLIGDVVIKGIEEDFWPVKISRVKGSLAIERCPNITSIDGLFLDPLNMVMEGNLAINNCPKLTSLQGCPFTVQGSLSITGNESLKSLEGAPEIVHENVYVMKNGKKFKEEVIKRFIKLPYKRICCSVESFDELVNEGQINEAFSSPYLIELFKQCKEFKVDLKSALTEHYGMELEWDKLDSSNIKEYTKMDAKEKAKARNVISQRDNMYGVILLRDKDGEYTHMISHLKQVYFLGKLVYSYHRHWNTESSSYLMELVDKADSMVIISWDWDMKRVTVQKKHDRAQARSGMVENTPEYYEQVARENMERYKKIIAQNRANGISKEMEKIDKDVEAICSAAIKFAQKLRSNVQPGNGIWDANKVEGLMEDIYGQRKYMGFDRRKGRSEYSGRDGLLFLYTEYSKAVIRVKSDGDGYYSKYMKEYERKLMDKIQELKKDLGL